MIRLSTVTHQLITALFPNSTVEEATKLLEEDCADNLFGY